jgi:hypothetical protein
MKAVLAFFVGVTLNPLVAQTPLACATQLVPLKPLSLYCSNATPICVTGQNGMNGRWVWGCPTGAATLPAQDPGQTFVDSYRWAQQQALRNRQIQQQAEFERERLEIERQGLDSPQATAASSDSTMVKAAYDCGMLDGMLKSMDAAGNAEGANGIREALKLTACEQIRTYAGVASAGDVPVAPSRQPDIGEPLDNAGVIHMVRTGFKDDTLIWVIGLRPAHYSLAQADRMALEAAGVSEAVIQAMAEKQAGR